MLSHVWLFETPWACQAPLSMEFSRQEYWSGLPFPSPEDLPDLGIQPRSPALQADSSPGAVNGKEPTCQFRTQVWSLGQEDLLEEGMTTYLSIAAWRISWTEEPGGLQSMVSQKVRHDWNDLACTCILNTVWYKQVTLLQWFNGSHRKGTTYLAEGLAKPTG